MRMNRDLSQGYTTNNLPDYRGIITTVEEYCASNRLKNVSKDLRSLTIPKPKRIETWF